MGAVGLLLLKFWEDNKSYPMESGKEQLRSAINLISRMPPSKMHKNQVGLISLVPDLEDNLLECIDLPHSTRRLT